MYEFFRKSNVDLPPKGDEKRRDAITLGNRNDNDNTLFLNVDQSGDNENDQLSDLGNTLGTLALGDTGSGSHGLGMMATSTLDNINNMQHLNNIDAESLSGFGSVSGIEAAAKSNLNQYQAKTHEITLNESESHISADSTVRRISLGTGTQNLPYDEIQDDCDIEIDFDDNEQEEFDENDAESVGDMEVEAGRAAIDSINISNVNLNDNNNDNDSVDDGMQSIEQLSAIKGPKPDIDVSVSDVASVASVASGVSIPSVGSDENMDNGNDNNGMPQVPLDESMGLPLDGGMVPQLDANAAVDDNASVASVASMRSEESLSTVELEEQRRKRQKRMRKDNDNDNNENDNENENDTDNENEDGGRSPRAQRKKKGSKAVKGGKAGKAAKRYKKSRKPRFVEEVGDNGQIEMDHNVGVNGQRDSYILPERDILHIWRERSMRDLTYDEMMRYPISMANELFGGGFGANYGNIIHEYQRYMPKHVLKCYNDILNKKRVPGVRHDDNDNLNESRTQDDMLGDMFDPAEIGRRGRENDNDNNYDSENAFDDNDNNPDVSPLIGENDSDLMMHNSSHEQESYLKQHKLDFNNDNTSVMNTTVLDAVVDDNILNLDASLAVDENGSHRHPIVEIVQEDAASLQNANLDSDNEDDKNDDEEEDDDIDIEINNNSNNNNNNNDNEDDENANENENKVEENNNNLQSQSQNQSQKNASQQTKYRSWSRRTQKTLQYLHNKEGNGFSFNEMMQESNKRETVAGVFYEMLVLKNANLIELEQEKCFEDITITVKFIFCFF